MFVVGLTGGIGSGKSTLAALLAERGAQVIDADELGRDALRPGQPAWHSVVTQFGDEILSPGTMQVDRKRLAGIVFNDKNKLAALNAIVHPVILAGIADGLERLQGTDDVVVIDAALLVNMGVNDLLDALVVVTAPIAARTRRLLARGMTKADVEARIASQVPQERLVEEADIVVSNGGSLEDLVTEADRAWQKILDRKGS